MTFKEGLLKARSHLIFLAGLVVAFGVVIRLETWDVQRQPAVAPRIVKTAPLSTVVPADLSATEQQWARIAWQYFVHNWQPATGLVNSVDGYPSSTMWDTASYLLALIAAQRLDIISRDTFDQRLSQALTTLAGLPLFEGALPNKVYHTISTAMVDYNNQATARGIGWSAIDIGRLLVPLNLIVWHYPAHTAEVQAILKRWAFTRLVRDGRLYGATLDAQGHTVYVQEGRLGYEAYAAKSLALLGLDVSEALQYQAFLHFVPLYGIDLPTDSRSAAQYHAHNYVVSEPYILDGLEFGWDETSREFAFRVYRVQEERFTRTGVLTAVSEDNIDQAPYFVYNTVFTDGQFWKAITDQGVDAAAYKSLSTKAVFGWEALYKTPYTTRLLTRMSTLYDAERGWYSGLYETTQTPNKAITANTNAIILESLYYRRFGKLLQLANENGSGAQAAR
jgi:hypothetical protein